MLAATEARFDWLKSTRAKGRYMGIESEVITPEEAHELMPMLDPAQFVGGLRTVVDGHLDPSGVTHAYAKSARKLGATVHTHTMVEDIARAPDGEWVLRTSKGEVRAEHVVNAGGLWAREVGRMVGLELPVLAMEHMYLITEDMPEVAEINAQDRQGGAPRRRLRRRALPPPGARRHADGHLREGRRALVAAATRPGSSATSCWPRTSTASPPRSRSASAISRPSRRPGSSRSSMAPSPSRRTATRWSARSAGCPASGRPAASWRGSARAAASGSRWRTG